MGKTKGAVTIGSGDFALLYVKAKTLDELVETIKKEHKTTYDEKKINAKVNACRKQGIKIKTLAARGWMETRQRGIQPLDVEAINKKLMGMKAFDASVTRQPKKAKAEA